MDASCPTLLHPTCLVVLAAATLPTYGLKSVDQYIKKVFPHVEKIQQDLMHRHHPALQQASTISPSHRPSVFDVSCRRRCLLWCFVSCTLARSPAMWMVGALWAKENVLVKSVLFAGDSSIGPRSLSRIDRSRDQVVVETLESCACSGDDWFGSCEPIRKQRCAMQKHASGESCVPARVVRAISRDDHYPCFAYFVQRRALVNRALCASIATEMYLVPLICTQCSWDGINTNLWAA